MSSHTYKEEITDREVADGDTINIDYVGKVDGVEFEGRQHPMAPAPR